MLGIGIDIVEIDRIKKQIDNKRFVEMVLSSEEIERFNNFSDIRKTEFLAGRFAAKEAIIKCLSDYENVNMNSLNITNNEKGKPEIKYKDYIILLSISHERHYAVAIASLEGRK